MLILKIAVAALISIGVLSPSIAPKGEKASCTCKAD
jgi:hypothetical protein